MARERALRAEYPERFKTDVDYRREAFERLAQIERKVLAIKAYWAEDSGGLFELCAITNEPSHAHFQYAAHFLYTIREIERAVERTDEFGRELAKSAGVEYYSAINADADRMPENGRRREA